MLSNHVTLPGFCIDHDLTLLVPCYNEQQRLGSTLAKLQVFLDSTPIDYRVLVVDDGSQDGTARFTAGMGPRFETLRLGRNRGKGAAVRAGMLAASGAVVGFTDADLPFDLDNIVAGYELIRERRCEIVFGARDLAGVTTQVPRRLLRRISTVAFRRLATLTLTNEVTDPQCGLKLFSRAAAIDIFSRVTIPGFAFDVEVVYLAYLLGIPFRRMPVSLVNEGASTLSLRRHALPMLTDLVKMRLRHGRLLNPASAARPALRGVVDSRRNPGVTRLAPST